MDISVYFKKAIDRGASDLHLVGGSIPSLRIGGELIKLTQEPLDKDDLEKSIASLVPKDVWRKFQEKKELDISQEFFNSRFRINFHYQEGKVGLAARLIPNFIPELEIIELGEVIRGLTRMKDGMILITGPSGSGKSTTLAAMIEIINKERRMHIITIEDPVEYLFKEDQSIIEQRELGRDTKSFASALKYALRQDPNVIMVGEMRDLETISAAITAAETGHLVLSTLHTSSSVETIDRIVDVFPSHQQKQILNQLSSTLRAVIAQQLIPKARGGRAVAREIMINNNAIANLIRRNQLGQIYTVIQTSSQDGMVTMNKSIDKLLKKGEISVDMARNRKRDLETKASYF